VAGCHERGKNPLVSAKYGEFFVYVQGFFLGRLLAEEL